MHIKKKNKKKTGWKKRNLLNMQVARKKKKYRRKHFHNILVIFKIPVQLLLTNKKIKIFTERRLIWKFHPYLPKELRRSTIGNNKIWDNFPNFNESHPTAHAEHTAPNYTVLQWYPLQALPDFKIKILHPLLKLYKHEFEKHIFIGLSENDDEKPSTLLSEPKSIQIFKQLKDFRDEHRFSTDFILFTMVIICHTYLENEFWNYKTQNEIISSVRS